MCDCVKKIVAEITPVNGVAWVDYTYGGNRIHLSAGYKTVTKKGTLAKHARYMSLSDRIKFCPFCGKPYGEED